MAIIDIHPELARRLLQSCNIFMVADHSINWILSRALLRLAGVEERFGESPMIIVRTTFASIHMDKIFIFSIGSRSELGECRLLLVCVREWVKGLTSDGIATNAVEVDSSFHWHAYQNWALLYYQRSDKKSSLPTQFKLSGASSIQLPAGRPWGAGMSSSYSN